MQGEPASRRGQHVTTLNGSELEWDVGDRAARLNAEALIWDCHAGFAYGPDVDLKDLDRWRNAGVNFVSVNVGFDVPPWSKLAIEAISNYRRQLRQHCDRFVQIETVEAVRQAQRDSKLAVAFDLEGTDALNGDFGMVEVFYRLGVRQMLLAYNRNNIVGGGCHDNDSGLTDIGGDVVKEMNRVGMIVDCTHCGFRTTVDVMGLSSAPVIFSHSNARALRDHERNTLNEQITACAAMGGVIRSQEWGSSSGLKAPGSTIWCATSITWSSWSAPAIGRRNGFGFPRQRACPSLAIPPRVLACQPVSRRRNGLRASRFLSEAHPGPARPRL